MKYNFLDEECPKWKDVFVRIFQPNNLFFVPQRPLYTFCGRAQMCVVRVSFVVDYNPSSVVIIKRNVIIETVRRVDRLFVHYRRTRARDFSSIFLSQSFDAW